MSYRGGFKGAKGPPRILPPRFQTVKCPICSHQVTLQTSDINPQQRFGVCPGCKAAYISPVEEAK